eukprot:TRINITY_DN2153_c0_g1_i1.p1 TRINITY_DN2153_c0_g1~~TRINITY_DN2153_c0_g1_i1.p1  ORF type:complete len:178 (+),score=41.57 TRINITY_DN2153_c0_g1_i1:33-566(+)
MCIRDRVSTQSTGLSVTRKMETQPEDKLKELNITLPPLTQSIGLYKTVIVVGNVAYVSGHPPKASDGTFLTGKVGADIDIDGGVAAARACGLNILASLRAHFGSLNKVKRVIKLVGFVNCVDGFTQQPKVVNGCSELFKDVFGEQNGISARSAVGANALPSNISVEVEGIFEIDTTS